MEDDDLDFYEEEMVVITRRFKKLFKKAKENFNKKNISKPISNDREQFTSCFKCGKRDHIVKKCPLLKEEQEIEQFCNVPRK